MYWYLCILHSWIYERFNRLYKSTAHTHTHKEEKERNWSCQLCGTMISPMLVTDAGFGRSRTWTFAHLRSYFWYSGISESAGGKQPIWNYYSFVRVSYSWISPFWVGKKKAIFTTGKTKEISRKQYIIRHKTPTGYAWYAFFVGHKRCKSRQISCTVMEWKNYGNFGYLG